MKQMKIRRPFDRHVHLRQGDMMKAVTPLTAQFFAGAICMPNTDPPVTTAKQAHRYRDEIRRVACSAGDPSFNPQIPLYLTHQTKARDVYEAWASRCVIGFKLYPCGATTKSGNGIVLERITELDPVFRVMEKFGIPLLQHGEVVPRGVENLSQAEQLASQFDREKRYVNEVLIPLARKYPKLKMVLEHVSSREGIEFVTSDEVEARNVYGTVTAHHLVYSQENVFAPCCGGFRVWDAHRYCYPVIKGSEHRRVLIEHLDSPKLGLGTDSAPHPSELKEEAEIEGRIPPGGCFTAPIALQKMYLEIFDQAGKLDAFENFASVNLLEEVYGIMPSEELITIREIKPTPVQTEYTSSNVEVCTPLSEHDTVRWEVEID